MIDDDLDFEVAKFTNTLRSSHSRPVTETDEEGQDWRVVCQILVDLTSS